jgi:serine protease Do
MRSTLLRVIGCIAPVFLFAMSSLTSPAAYAAPLPPGSAELVATLLPTVVAIEAIQLARPASNGQPAVIGGAYTGSGFIIDSSGLIVTNHHVVENAVDLYVTLADRTRLRADVIYISPIDMVLLKVNAGHPLPTVKWGDSAKMRPGDSVIAIGDPLAVGITVTAGIISALDRSIGETIYDDFLQTDAAINHGNSGGPLFNLEGEVIGVNTALISPGSGFAGLAFSIPSNNVKFIVDEYKKYGRVRLAYFGADVQPVTQDMADGVGLPSPEGVIVASVAPGSPAEKAQLRPGDIILKLNDNEIDQPRTYNRIAAISPFGEPVPLVLWRDGAEKTLSVTLVESPKSQAAAAALPTTAAPSASNEVTATTLGITMAPITDDLRTKFNLAADQKGVVITEVQPQSLADQRGLKAGDVVIQVANKPIETPEDLRQAVAAARQANQRALLVLAKQGDAVRWVGVPLVKS